MELDVRRSRRARGTEPGTLKQQRLDHLASRRRIGKRLVLRNQPGGLGE